MKFGEWLLQELKKRNLSQRAFARLCGESQSNISKVILGKLEPSMPFCVSVAHGLDVHPSIVFEAAGYEVLPQRYDELTDKVAQAVRDLGEDDKRHVLEIVKMIKEGRAIYLMGGSHDRP